MSTGAHAGPVPHRHATGDGMVTHRHTAAAADAGHTHPLPFRGATGPMKSLLSDLAPAPWPGRRGGGYRS